MNDNGDDDSNDGDEAKRMSTQGLSSG